MSARSDAKEEGNVTYKSKTPCKNCGSVVKYVSSSGCQACQTIIGLKKLANNELMAPYHTPEKQNKRLREWRKNNPEKYKKQLIRGRAGQKKYYENNKDAAKNRALKRAYGITLEEYNILLASQNFVCKICKNCCSTS